MGARIARTAARAGIPSADGERITAAYDAAIDARAGFIDDPEHFAFLHPGRNVLIAIQDAGVRDAAVLCACALLDAERPERMPAMAVRRTVLPPSGAALLEAVPLAARIADDDELLERLLAAERDAALAALVDRLDFVRHLHLESGVDRAAAHRRTAHAYLPVAVRVDATLHRRFAWWLGTFERRNLHHRG